MSMFPIMKKRLDPKALVAVGITPDGIGVVRITREDGIPPVLDVCEILEVKDTEQRTGLLKSLARQYNLTRVSCTWVLSPDVYALLLVDAPDVPPEELKAAMRWRIKDLINFSVDEAVVDVFNVPGHKGQGGNHMQYVVAARMREVRENIDLIEAAGLPLATIDIQELALRNLAALLPEDVAGLAMVYLGPESGIIVLTRRSTLYLTRRFSFDWRALSSDAAGNGAAVDKGLSPPLQAVLDGLVVEVQRSMDYYDSHYTQAPITNLVIAPMPIAVPGMTGYLSSQLGLAVRSFDINDLVDSREPLAGDLQAYFTPIVGAALRQEKQAS